MRHRKTYMNINLQQIRVSIDQSKPCTQLYLQIIASCVNLQVPIVILKKNIISDIHHRVTYIYINFQQIWVSGSVKTMLRNIFAKNSKLYKFATTNSNFDKID